MPTPTATPDDIPIRRLARQTMLTVLLLTILAATTSLVFVAPAVPRAELEASQPKPSSAVLARVLSAPGRTQIEAGAPMQVCRERLG